VIWVVRVSERVRQHDLRLDAAEAAHDLVDELGRLA
jgi:hypothetical protein